MRRSLAALSMCVALALGAGCSRPDLRASCNPTEARKIVYDGRGQPYYEGQAMVYGVCGRCHALETTRHQVVTRDGGLEYVAATRSAPRFGAPFTHNFDVKPACTSGDLSGLRVTQATTIRYMNDVDSVVTSGAMPPNPREWDTGYFDAFTDATGNPVPKLDLATRARVVRNWLGCDAPVIVSASNTGLTAPALGEVVDSRPSSTGTILLTFSGEPVTELNGIYDRIISARHGANCQRGGCHGSERPEGNLDLSDLDRAYRNLVNQPAAGPGCGPDRVPAGPPLTRVVPGDVGASLMLHKLAAATCADPANASLPVCVELTAQLPCGDPMPLIGCVLSPGELAALTEWVRMGARR